MSDLIDRQAAIEAVHEEFDECLVWDESGKCTADEVEIILESLPSAQPVQYGWVCPVCGRGLSPLTMVCPCNNGKGWEITCKT